MADNNKPLQGVGVLVTRPEHQALSLCQGIEQAGGKAIPFPVVEIQDIDDTSPLIEQIDRLDQFDIAIFISPNAVQKALNVIKTRRELPPNLRIAAIGRTSAKALETRGVAVNLFPSQRFDSEALLELEPMQHVRGKKVIIFRGEGGREMLAETLKARGAHVEYAECYRRAKPQADATPLLRLWARDEIHVVVITSGEGLHNLYDMVGQLGRQWLQKTQLLVVSERIGDMARELGFKRPPLISPHANDENILKTLIEWRAFAKEPT